RGPARLARRAVGPLVVLRHLPDAAVEADHAGARAVRVVEEDDAVPGEELEPGARPDHPGPRDDRARARVDDPDLAGGVVRHEEPAAGLDRGAEVAAGRAERDHRTAP